MDQESKVGGAKSKAEAKAPSQKPVSAGGQQSQIRLIQGTPVGSLLAKVVAGKLTELDFISAPEAQQQAIALAHESAAQYPKQASDQQVLDLLEIELAAYFSRQLQHFSVPLAPAGTVFQQQVWAALQTIPYGVTWSYKELASAVKKPKGYQAVGQANGRNPVVILIPCHRVIAADGSLGGYGGGLARKVCLLGLEQHKQLELV